MECLAPACPISHLVPLNSEPCPIGSLWSKDALAWELQKILQANGNGKHKDRLEIQRLDLAMAETRLTEFLELMKLQENRDVEG